MSRRDHRRSPSQQIEAHVLIACSASKPYAAGKDEQIRAMLPRGQLDCSTCAAGVMRPLVTEDNASSKPNFGGQASINVERSTQTSSTEGKIRERREEDGRKESRRGRGRKGARFDELEVKSGACRRQAATASEAWATLCALRFIQRAACGLAETDCSCIRTSLRALSLDAKDAERGDVAPDDRQSTSRLQKERTRSGRLPRSARSLGRAGCMSTARIPFPPATPTCTRPVRCTHRAITPLCRWRSAPMRAAA
mmetsp:Transcript_36175/g.79521  ORF Transcript_36175/g.79521 Transcript_36175/m.79521 type:complete len:253 (-) Transcript_36175:1439-2197(-)